MYTARRREMATTTTREPAYRKDGGIEVAVFWDRLTGKRRFASPTARRASLCSNNLSTTILGSRSPNDLKPEGARHDD
jgi:hypothetical protein